MRKQRDFIDATFHAAAVCLVAGSAFLTPLCAQTGKGKILQPTPVAGESWLQHLHRSFDDTSMGKTGQLGPAGAALLPRSRRGSGRKIIPSIRQ